MPTNSITRVTPGFTICESAVMVTAALLVLGAVMVASATASMQTADVPFWQTVWARHVGLAILAWTVLLGTIRCTTTALGTDVWQRRIALASLAIATIALLATWLPGWAVARHGSHRWLHIEAGGMRFGFQPSALVKPALVLAMAWILTRPGVEQRRFRSCFLPAAGVLGIIVMLVGRADFGTAALIAVVGASMMVVAGCRRLHLAALAGAGAVVLVGLLASADYRLRRLTSFWDPLVDPLGAGYQPRQSLIAVASGGWSGRGLGQGIQKLGYLPEVHSDFIFSSICEETGVVGAGLILLLIGGMVVLGLKVLAEARTPYDRLLAFGVTLMFSLQAVMHIAVATAVTPTTGISLPLVSSGGSGLVTYCLSIGLLAGAARRVGMECAVIRSQIER